jgi:ribonuclease HII
MESFRLLPFLKPDCVEAGIDEAGRGCLAGPVVAAAVILPPLFSHPLLNDSKKLSHKQRTELRILVEQEALYWEVCFVDHEEIDRINILNATFLAMNRAIEGLKATPSHLIIDGNRFKPSTKNNSIPFSCVIKGDAKYQSIAAASILAKTHRDEYMETLHAQFPHYSWSSNKGYPTEEHRNGIRMFGPCPFHRKTFALLNDQLDLFE